MEFYFAIYLKWTTLRQFAKFYRTKLNTNYGLYDKVSKGING